jgi:DNA (cytosine-5)-methyltransferase 1
VNRVFLPSSDIFPTLVASDTNDYVATKDIVPSDSETYRAEFLREIYQAGAFRKITREEACEIQGFPRDFLLPDSRARWMKLIGNSVSVPVVERLSAAIIETGVVHAHDCASQEIPKSA